MLGKITTEDHTIVVPNLVYSSDDKRKKGS